MLSPALTITRTTSPAVMFSPNSGSFEISRVEEQNYRC